MKGLEPLMPPVSAQQLRDRALSETFVNYMKRWPGLFTKPMVKTSAGVLAREPVSAFSHRHEPLAPKPFFLVPLSSRQGTLSTCSVSLGMTDESWTNLDCRFCVLLFTAEASADRRSTIGNLLIPDADDVFIYPRLVRCADSISFDIVSPSLEAAPARPGAATLILSYADTWALGSRAIAVTFMVQLRMRLLAMATSRFMRGDGGVATLNTISEAARFLRYLEWGAGSSLGPR